MEVSLSTDSWITAYQNYSWVFTLKLRPQWSCKLKTKPNRVGKQLLTCPTVSGKFCPVRNFCPLEDFMLLSLLCLLPQTLSRISLGGNCIAPLLSMNHQHQHVSSIKLACWLPGLLDKRDFYKIPLSIGFLCFMRSVQGTGRISSSGNSTSRSKMNSNNLPKSIQIFVSWLSVSSQTWI